MIGEDGFVRGLRERVGGLGGMGGMEGLIGVGGDSMGERGQGKGRRRGHGRV